MKEQIEKKLKEVKEEHDKHMANLQQLENAKEKCIAQINACKGKIQVLEELSK